MVTSGPAQPPPTEESPFEEILLLCLQRILADEQPLPFLRWAQKQLVPRLQREEPDLEEVEAQRLAFLLARAIWDATPLPSGGFRPQPLNNPHPALSCPCGSGLAYGQCCGAIQNLPVIPQELMWELLLAELPEPLFRQALASGEVPGPLLGLAAERWLMVDRPGLAIALLEPLFSPEAATQMDERGDHALNVLCDAYDRRDHGKKKRQFLDRMRQHPCRGLRAAAWRRLCTIHIDEGAFIEAQLAYTQAQREAPDNPGTALLEIALLATQHEDDLARDRALFWRHKLRRGEEADIAILDFLAQAGTDPQDALMTSQADILDPCLMDLRDWVQASIRRPLPTYILVLAPIPSPCPTSAPTAAEVSTTAAPAKMGIGDGASALSNPGSATNAGGMATGESSWGAAMGKTSASEQPQYPIQGAAGLPHPAPVSDWSQCLEPPGALVALERDWHRVYPGTKPLGLQLVLPPASPHPWEPDEGGAEDWLDFLNDHPEAADSLDILDDLVTALYVHPDTALSWVRHTLVTPLLARAQAILGQALSADGRTTTLPWDAAENRPALRLLFRHYLSQVESGAEAVAIASLETLLSLNPWDHHGLRADLMNHYLRQGDDAAALALARRYPEDRLVDLVYGEVLALYRGGAAQQARQALRRAQGQLPLIPRYLTQKRVARPSARERTPTPTSAETAWFYRESMRDVWSAVPGLLDWLKRQAG